MKLKFGMIATIVTMVPVLVTGILIELLNIVFEKCLEGVSMWQLKTFINFCGVHCSVAYGIGTV